MIVMSFSSSAGISSIGLTMTIVLYVFLSEEATSRSRRITDMFWPLRNGWKSLNT